MSSALASMEQAGEILIDTRPPPNMADLRKRQSGSTTTLDSISSSTVLSSSITSAASLSSTSTSSSPTSIATDPGSSGGGTLPSPFDSGVGSNFTTTSCPNFLKSFLENPTFKSCLPFSLLLQNSQSFFQAEKSIVRVTQALDATCNVNVSECANTMSTLARNIKLPSNCGSDYNAQNPLVVQAYQGLLAYEPLYRAGCAAAPSTGSYCFANAITNTTNTADSYVYFLPLGITLPGGARPTCNSCLQSTMAIYAAFAGNTTQPLSGTYVSAAQQINIGCGPNFVNATATHISQSSPSLQPPPLLIYLILTTFLLNYLFQ
ncbi:MAG: hypothetical protein M1839_001319 [Geoglossum umbratile]|nr:MAG: hypothetical protein M1839_001319 [Geoglossum umbratile]